MVNTAILVRRNALVKEVELCRLASFILTWTRSKGSKNFVYPRADYHWISQSDFIVGPFETRTVDHLANGRYVTAP
jgi:hypothetical protein